MNDYQRAQAEKDAAWLVVAQAIAELLGASVLPAHGRGDDGYMGRFALSRPNGDEIALCFGLANYKGKIHITGSYLADTRCALAYNEKRPSISVSVLKTPEQIAKDIQRRFLPAYLPLAAACRERKAQDEARAARQEELLSSLVQDYKGRVTRYGNSDSGLHISGAGVGKAYGHVKNISGDSSTCNLELSNCPLSVLKQILSLI